MDNATGDLAFLPLGGTGEIGMNFNLYRYGGKYLAVDCGIGFGGNELPEAEIIMPDPAFIAERRDRLVGLIITHAHEDHVGAVADTSVAPVALPGLHHALHRGGAAAQAGRGAAAERGEDPCDPAPAAASTSSLQAAIHPRRPQHAEAQALAIRTPAGLVVHTGDWKLDPHPMVGPPTDEAAFAGARR